jgi:hypothetical protein
MMFVGLLYCPVLIISYLQHYSFLMIILLYFTDTSNFGHASALIYPVMTILTRAIIIAVRYAYMPKLRYQVMKQYQAFNFIWDDLIITSWVNLDFKSIFNEINSTIKRNRIETTDFKYQFLLPLSNDMHERMNDEDFYDNNNMKFADAGKFYKKLKKEDVSNLEEKPKLSLPNVNRSDVSNNEIIAPEVAISMSRKVIPKIHESSFARIKKRSDILGKNRMILSKTAEESYVAELENSENFYYKGNNLLREIAIIDSVETPSSDLAGISIGIRGLITSALMVYNYKGTLSRSRSQWIMFGCLLYIGISLHYVNLRFVAAGLTDFRRKLFFQKVMSMLIDPEKRATDKEHKKLVPCLNLLDSKTLRRWMYLKRSSLDFGKKFTHRIFLYCSIFLIGYGLLAVIFTLSYFDILKYDFPIETIVLGYFDVIVILGILSQMLNTGAEVNTYFLKHKTLLLALKRHYLLIKDNYEILKNKKKFESDCLKLLILKLNEMNLTKEQVETRLDK